MSGEEETLPAETPSEGQRVTAEMKRYFQKLSDNPELISDAMFDYINDPKLDPVQKSHACARSAMGIKAAAEGTAQNDCFKLIHLLQAQIDGHTRDLIDRHSRKLG